MTTTNDIGKPMVKHAHYVEAFMIAIAFTDGKNTIVDFQPFLQNHQNGYLKKYTDPSNFKDFHIEDGNLVWGENWDLIFPVTQLHRGKIEL